MTEHSTYPGESDIRRIIGIMSRGGDDKGTLWRIIDEANSQLDSGSGTYYRSIPEFLVSIGISHVIGIMDDKTTVPISNDHYGILPASSVHSLVGYRMEYKVPRIYTLSDNGGMNTMSRIHSNDIDKYIADNCKKVGDVCYLIQGLLFIRKASNKGVYTMILTPNSFRKHAKMYVRDGKEYAEVSISIHGHNICIPIPPEITPEIKDWIIR